MNPDCTLFLLTGNYTFETMKTALLQTWTYVPPVIIATGIIGNILSLIAVTNRHCKKSSFTVYLAALAVFDTSFLLSFLFTIWLKYIFEIDIEIMGGVTMCRVYTFCSYLFPIMSSWMVVCLTVERWFCTAFPLKMKRASRTQTAAVVITVILTVQVSLNAHTLIGIGHFSDGNTSTCFFNSMNYANFIFYYWGWIVIADYYFLPVIIIIVANTSTVLKIYRTTRSLTSTGSDTIRRRNRSIKIITLSVSTAFILLASPQAALLTLRPFLFDDLKYFYPNSEAEQIFEAVGYIGISLNHSINFLFYCLSGKRFRKDLKAAFVSCRQPARNTLSSATPNGSSMTSKPDHQLAASTKRNMHPDSMVSCIANPQY